MLLLFYEKFNHYNRDDHGKVIPINQINNPKFIHNIQLCIKIASLFGFSIK